MFYLDYSGDDYIGVCICQKFMKFYLKWVHYTVYKLYPSELGFKNTNIF